MLVPNMAICGLACLKFEEVCFGLVSVPEDTFTFFRGPHDWCLARRIPFPGWGFCMGVHPLTWNLTFGTRSLEKEDGPNQDPPVRDGRVPFRTREMATPPREPHRHDDARALAGDDDARQGTSWISPPSNLPLQKKDLLIAIGERIFRLFFQ